MRQVSFVRNGQDNPSTWPHRLPVIFFSFLGFGIAAYLTMYQVDLLSQVWEPFFGEGSRWILKESAIARWSPVPDASLGALAYLLDVLLNCIGQQDRWRTAPWTVLAVGVVSGALAVGGIVLTACQAFVFHHFCTLCLASAVCSLLAAAFAVAEVRAAGQFVREERQRGVSWRHALRGVHGN